jgi:hypothetical protein
MFVMDGVDDLRAQAEQWRRLAARCRSGLAGALIRAAAAIDFQADRIEAGKTVPPAEAGNPDWQNRG